MGGGSAVEGGVGAGVAGGVGAPQSKARAGLASIMAVITAEFKISQKWEIRFLRTLMALPPVLRCRWPDPVERRDNVRMPAGGQPGI
jgi:hypothetical protein